MESQQDEAVQIKGSSTSSDAQDQGAEKGAKNKTTEITEGSTSEPSLSGPGRLKKTAMKLFGGKKGICTLPSFFGGGRSKGSGKGSSKKGLNKSKTHNGLSEASHGPEDAVIEETDLSTPFSKSPSQFPSSQSANGALEIGSRHKTSVTEIEKAGVEKVPCVHKPKKSLKSFFSSIRHHRKSKVSGADQSGPGAKELEGARTRSHEHVSSNSLPSSEEIFRDARKENAKPQDAPGPKISPAREHFSPTTEKAACKNPDKLTRTCASEFMQPKPVLEASSLEEPHTSETEGKVVTGEANPPNGPVGDQLSLLFGDVTSLKSFDSLTGCGDIIAEQDMDSMTDSMASGGQRANRDGTKRSSCLVTYQGGGEEMALPDDDDNEEEEEEEDEEVELEDEEEEVKDGEEDDDLEYLWASAQVYPRFNMNVGYHTAISPSHQGYMLLDPVQSYPSLGLGEILTPQSDQQESAPNSDEGYYDSTTPGFEDDSGEALGLVHRDCLPRDSYSGDALYEFYEPDDSLEHSPPGDDCLYDLRGRNSEMLDPFLNLEPFSSRPPGAMETEEERLVTIQKQLLYWELRREQREAQEACAREAHAREAYARDTHTRESYSRNVRARETPAPEVHSQEGRVQETKVRQEKPALEYQMRPLGPSVMGLVAGTSGGSQTSHRGTTSAFPATSSSEPDWRDFRPLEKRFEGTCSKKDQSTCLMQLFQSDAMFEPDVQEANFGGSPRKAYPSYSPPEEPEEEEEDEKEGNATVSFSQALVKFTSNGNLFTSMSYSSDSDSSFTQNLPELPPMVTFDIADVERDGEGKCEENPEFNNDEDLTASLEAFELGYYHKHAFNSYHSRFYQGLPWGVSSLPRYLGLPGIHPRPPPAAMALNRRSRSLDNAETLELELSSSHLAQGYMESDELQAHQEDSDEEGEEEEGEWGRDSPLSLYTEPPGVYDWPPWAHCPLPVGPGLAWISPNQLDEPFNQASYVQATCCVPPVAMPVSVPGRAPGDSVSQLARPSHLPLPMGPCYNLQSQASQSGRARPRDVLLPVDEPSCSSISGANSRSQAKPVGITHGIPQLPRVRPEPFQLQPNHYRASNLDLSKERGEQGASLSTSYSSTAMNGNLAK